MKKTFLVVIIVAAFATFYSFKTKPVYQYFYLVFNGGTEYSLNNYSVNEIQPNHMPGTGQLYWFRVEDSDFSGTISTTEFETAFDLYNQVNYSSFLLSDEVQDVPNEMDIREQ